MKPKSKNLNKILRWISREEQFERNGGGHFVAMNRKYKDNSKYDRKTIKKETRDSCVSYLFLF